MRNSMRLWDQDDYFNTSNREKDYLKWYDLAEVGVEIVSMCI